MKSRRTQAASYRSPFWQSTYGMAFFIIAAVTVFFLSDRDKAHIGGYLLFLLLAPLLLLHLYMHRGLGHDHDASESAEDTTIKVLPPEWQKQ